MFQTTDSSNDEIYGFHGESQPNGKSSKSFEPTNKQIIFPIDLICVAIYVRKKSCRFEFY